MDMAMPLSESTGVSLGSYNAVEQLSDKSSSVIKVRPITHAGFLFRVRVVQKDEFCPMYSVEGVVPVGYALLSDGPFSFRLDTTLSDPVVAKLEVNGKMYASEFRLQPYGGRVIREVNERHIATTQLLTYRFPIVYDNVMEREVGPHEVELQSAEDMEEFTSVCRVLFFPVRGGASATRSGQWAVDPTAQPLDVVIVRLGHRVTLSRLFGVRLTQTKKGTEQLPPTTPKSKSTSQLINNHSSSNYSYNNNNINTPINSARRGSMTTRSAPSSAARRHSICGAPNTPKSANKKINNSARQRSSSVYSNNAAAANSNSNYIIAQRDPDGRSPPRLSSRSASEISNSQRVKKVSRALHLASPSEPSTPQLNKSKSGHFNRPPTGAHETTLRSSQSMDSSQLMNPKISSHHAPQRPRATSLGEAPHIVPPQPHSYKNPLPAPLPLNPKITAGSNITNNNNNNINNNINTPAPGNGSTSPSIRRTRAAESARSSTAGKNYPATSAGEPNASSRSASAVSESTISQNTRICARCNAAFDRERRMFEEIIEALHRQANMHERERTQMQMRCESLQSLLEAVRSSRETQARQTPESVELRESAFTREVPTDSLEGTLTPQNAGVLPQPHPQQLRKQQLNRKKMNKKTELSDDCTTNDDETASEIKSGSEMFNHASNGRDRSNNWSPTESLSNDTGINSYAGSESERNRSAHLSVPKTRNGRW